MSPEAATIVTWVGSTIAAAVTAGSAYLFTKWREREAEWRKDRREYYKALVASMSLCIEGESTPEGLVAFNRATNDLNLIAPQRVLEAITAYRKETSITNSNRTQDRYDQVLSRLMYEMRKDLAMRPKDDEITFRVHLWSSGVKPKKTLSGTE